MEVLYYNKYLSEKIAKLIKTNPYLACDEYEGYLNDYPSDYNSWCMYISTLINLREFELAEKKLSYIEKIIVSDKKYLSDPKFNYVKSKDAFFCKVKLLSYTHKYQELYDIIRYGENRYYVIDLGFYKSLVLYCRMRLGKPIDKRYVGDSYFCNQIVDYSYDRMKEHVKQHTADYNSMLKTPELSVFSSDFPLDFIIEKLGGLFDTKNRLCLGFFDDTYYFKFDNCGRVRDKVTNYFKVVCFNDTFDIITMCPTETADKLPFVDLNSLIEKHDLSKVKCISARERFNRRYGKK